MRDEVKLLKEQNREWLDLINKQANYTEYLEAKISTLESEILLLKERIKYRVKQEMVGLI